MNKQLLEFDSFEKDYLKWARLYSLDKYNTFDKTKVKDTFDVVALEDMLLDESINSIEELHKINNLINNRGLKQMATLSMAIKKFYYYAKDRVNSFNELNSDLIKQYVNKDCIDQNLVYKTRCNYKNNLVAFLTFVNNENSDKIKLEIEKKIEVISNSDDKKNPYKLIDWMDSKMVKHFIKSMVSFAYPNEFEKCRDILITRLLICGGLEVTELVNVKEEDFTFETNSMSINVTKSNGNTREVPLPKALFIRYYNEYLKIKDSESDLFFYSTKDSNKPIEKSLVKSIVEKLVNFSKINVRDKTPKMLRKSYIIFIHNEKNRIGLTQPLANVQKLSGIENVSDLKEILKYATVDLITASDGFESLNIK